MESITGEEFAPWYKEALNQARATGIDRQELVWLVLAWTDLDRLTVQLKDFTGRKITLKKPWPELQQAWEKRLIDQCPVQYLVGEVTWRHLTLKVTPAVLIPRPETELMIDIVHHQGFDSHTIGPWVDMGTGSGAIALALAQEFPNAPIYAVDQSADALAIAQENRQINNLTNRVHFYQGSWWSPLTFLTGQVQGMVANPPYIPHNLLPTLDRPVRDHEPLLALDGGPDGLDSVRELIRRSPTYLQPRGLWLVELMMGQALAVKTLLEQQGDYDEIQIYPDLAGIDRFVAARRR